MVKKMKTKKIKGFDFVIIGILAGLVAILDIVAVIGLPTGILSVSSLYIGAAFYLLFIEAFGIRGVLAVYLGLLIASFSTTGFSIMPLILAWGNVFAPLLIIFAMKKMKLTYNFSNIKERIVEILVMLVAPLVSGLWILGGFVLFKIIPGSAFFVTLVPWEIGGAIVYIFLGIPLLKFVLPLFKKFDL